MDMSNLEETLVNAAREIKTADGLLITAGAGMGVDSGLPDFRSENGFWNAYPALGRQKLNFMSIASPQAFRINPALAWGFYGHRLKIYRETIPHRGFSLLQKFAQQLKHGAFVYTSNVDGQFQKAGFDSERVEECHGSIHRLQCLDNCTDATWSSSRVQPVIDEATCHMTSPLPKCPFCGGLARPNILMFDDMGWIFRELHPGQLECRDWLHSVKHLVIIEIGAGTEIPRVRLFSERAKGTLIRINPREPNGRLSSFYSLPMPALDALSALYERWKSL